MKLASCYFTATFNVKFVIRCDISCIVLNVFQPTKLNHLIHTYIQIYIAPK